MSTREWQASSIGAFLPDFLPYLEVRHQVFDAMLSIEATILLLFPSVELLLSNNHEVVSSSPRQNPNLHANKGLTRNCLVFQHLTKICVKL